MIYIFQSTLQTEEIQGRWIMRQWQLLQLSSDVSNDVHYY